jgi:NhaP-type Na+/H+ or K+/H+ antiporter
MHGTQLLLETVAVAIFLGITAQVVAERFKLPAILPLLVLGMAAGPQALGLLRPSDLGEGLEVLIKLGVAIILFEGGLSLDPRQLRLVGAPVRNLLTVGVLVTGVAAAWLAYVIADLSFGSAALFGAIVTVTGPTVIVPLLRHMIAPRRVRTILVSEGLIVDPIGAVLAYLVLQWIERSAQPLQELMPELLVLTATGTVLGFVAGSVAKFAARSRFVGRELRNLVILALLVGCFMLAERQVPESGILASVIMGLTMSAAKIPDLEPLRAFKEQLTVLLISVLFILLAGSLDLGAMMALGWRGLAVGAALILVVRPLAVAASVWPSHLDWRERTVLALTAPRGIVAAAVASLSAIQLRSAGVAGATELEGLVYLAILMTGLWATAMAVLLPRLLGYVGDPSRRLTVLVGANPLTTLLARALMEADRKVVVVDSVARKLEPLRRLGALTVRGDARDASTYENAGVERDTHVLAVTTNDELNLLVAELVREEFGVEHPVVAMQRPSEEFGSKRRAWVDLLGGRGLDINRWIRLAETDRLAVVSLPMEAEQAQMTVRDLVRDEEPQAMFLCGWVGGDPLFKPEVEDLGRFESVTLLAVEGEASGALAEHAEGVERGEVEGPLPEEEPAPLVPSRQGG